MTTYRKRTPLQIQSAVIFALIIRELKTRAGRYQLGYAWVLLEPTITISVLTIVWKVLGRTNVFNIPVELYLITGIIPFSYFRGSIFRSLQAIQSNLGLLTFRQVKPFDTIMSRLILELMVGFIVYWIFLFVAYWFLGFDVRIDDPLRLLMATASLVVLTFGVSGVFAIYGKLYPEVFKVVPQITTRPLFFISGLIFPIYIVPHQYHVYLLWNPVLHIIETMHMAFFREFISSPEINLFFPTVFGLVSSLIAFISYRYYREKLVRS